MVQLTWTVQQHIVIVPELIQLIFQPLTILQQKSTNNKAYVIDHHSIRIFSINYDDKLIDDDILCFGTHSIQYTRPPLGPKFSLSITSSTFMIVLISRIKLILILRKMWKLTIHTEASFVFKEICCRIKIAYKLCLFYLLHDNY